MALHYTSISEKRKAIQTSRNMLSDLEKSLSNLDSWVRNSINEGLRADTISVRANKALEVLMLQAEEVVIKIKEIDWDYQEYLIPSMSEGITTTINAVAATDKLVDPGSTGIFSTFQTDDRVKVSNSQANISGSLITLSAATPDELTSSVDISSDALHDTGTTLELFRRNRPNKVLPYSIETAAVTTDTLGNATSTPSLGMYGRLLAILYINGVAVSPEINIADDSNTLLDGIFPDPIYIFLLSPVHTMSDCDPTIQITNGGNTQEHSFAFIYLPYER